VCRCNSVLTPFFPHLLASFHYTPHLCNASPTEAIIPSRQQPRPEGVPIPNFLTGISMVLPRNPPSIASLGVLGLRLRYGPTRPCLHDYPRFSTTVRNWRGWLLHLPFDVVNNLAEALAQAQLKDGTTDSVLGRIRPLLRRYKMRDHDHLSSQRDVNSHTSFQSSSFRNLGN